MPRYALILFSLLLIAGCGADSTSTTTDTQTQDDDTPAVTDVVGTGITYEIDQRDGSNFDITVTNSTITISGESVIGFVEITASNIIFVIEYGATIEGVELFGNDNHITIPASVADVVSISGLGNELIIIE